MKKFEQYPSENWEVMVDGLADATYGIDMLLKKGHMPLLEGGRMAAEKFLIDEDETAIPIKGTRRPSTRGERRKATAKAKENALSKSRHTRKGSYVPIYRGEHGETKMKAIPISEWLQEGEKAFWKYVPAAKRTGNRQRYDWKKEVSRLRRHEGKNLCFNYEAEDATEIEDIWLTPDEGWLEDYPEEAERLEDLENQERIEWLQSLEDEVYSQDLETGTELYEAFLSEFKLWTLFYEWKKRKGGIIYS